MVAKAGADGKAKKEAPKRRRPGRGSVYWHEAVGLWRGFFKPKGQPPINVSGRTYKEAADNLDAKLDELKKGLLSPASQDSFAAYLEGWLAGRRYSVRANTYRGYEGHVRLYLAKELGRRPLNDLTSGDFSKLFSSLIARGLSGQTVQHVRATARAALQAAVDEGVIRRNAATLAPPPRIKKYEAAILDREQGLAFLAACQGHPLGTLYTVSLGMGMRRSEVVGLQRGDIDLPGRTIAVSRGAHHAKIAGGAYVEEPKSHTSRRLLRMPEFVASALERHLGTLGASVTKTSLMFPGKNGGPYHPDYISHAIHKLLRAAGLPAITLHGLRHTMTTLLLEEGISSREVAAILGHSTSRLVDERYGHITPRMSAASAAAMDAVLPTSEASKLQSATAAPAAEEAESPAQQGVREHQAQ